jgi:hypothetical protein
MKMTSNTPFMNGKQSIPLSGSCSDGTVSPDLKFIPDLEPATSMIMIPHTAPAATDTTTTTTTNTRITTSKVTTTPPSRWGHTLTPIQNQCVVLYGGQTVHSEDTNVASTLSDLYVYDCQTQQFSKPIQCDGVELQCHSAAYLPQQQLMIAFGGEAPDNKGKMKTLNQVMVLDTEIMLWYDMVVLCCVVSHLSYKSLLMLSQPSPFSIPFIILHF